MAGPVPLRVWYLSVYFLSALVVAITGYLVATASDGHHRGTFVTYTAIQCTWLGFATAKLLVAAPTLKYLLALVTDALALLSIVAVGYFATVYTNHSPSPRKPQNAVVVAWMIVGLAGIVTQPLLELNYAVISYPQTPFPYFAIQPGPIYLLNSAMTATVILVAITYLAQLFSRSTHRPTGSILLLVVTLTVSYLPNLITTIRTVPVLPGYDYTAFGIVPGTVVLAYTVYFRGELDLAPMARKEVVEEIDDALFGLDDSGRVIDYNAAAERLLPADVAVPVGEPLVDLLPDLEAELSLPDAENDDITGTFSTVTDGERTHYSMSVSALTERDTVAGYTVVLRDVTDIETSKRELERQNEQLESFASTVAHDLRNPIQVADGTSALLIGQLDSAARPADEAAVDHLERVNDSIGQIDDRLRELETLAKHAQSVTDSEPMAFETAARNAWTEVDTGDMTLSVPVAGTITAEAGRLDSVLEQLVASSVQRGGSRVVAELTHTGFVYTDDGRAIPETDREAIFESNVTTATETVGLGFEIVRAQVNSQGWEITVEESERGTAFVVTGAETSRDTAVEPTTGGERP